jgi:hypothetical protein
MSFSSPALFGERKQAFEKDLQSSLTELNPSGVFETEERFYALLARRRGQE